jgi:hypothetical protein
MAIDSSDVYAVSVFRVKGEGRMDSETPGSYHNTTRRRNLEECHLNVPSSSLSDVHNIRGKGVPVLN